MLSLLQDIDSLITRSREEIHRESAIQRQEFISTVETACRSQLLAAELLREKLESDVESWGAAARFEALRSLSLESQVSARLRDREETVLSLLGDLSMELEALSVSERQRTFQSESDKMHALCTTQRLVQLEEMAERELRLRRASLESEANRLKMKWALLLEEVDKFKEEKRSYRQEQKDLLRRLARSPASMSFDDNDSHDTQVALLVRCLHSPSHRWVEEVSAFSFVPSPQCDANDDNERQTIKAVKLLLVEGDSQTITFQLPKRMIRRYAGGKCVITIPHPAITLTGNRGSAVCSFVDESGLVTFENVSLERGVTPSREVNVARRGIVTQLCLSFFASIVDCVPSTSVLRPLQQHLDDILPPNTLPVTIAIPFRLLPLPTAVLKECSLTETTNSSPLDMVALYEVNDPPCEEFFSTFTLKVDDGACERTVFPAGHRLGESTLSTTDDVGTRSPLEVCFVFERGTDVAVTLTLGLKLCCNDETITLLRHERFPSKTFVEGSDSRSSESKPRSDHNCWTLLPNPLHHSFVCCNSATGAMYEIADTALDTPPESGSALPIRSVGPVALWVPCDGEMVCLVTTDNEVGERCIRVFSLDEREVLYDTQLPLSPELSYCFEEGIAVDITAITPLDGSEWVAIVSPVDVTLLGVGGNWQTRTIYCQPRETATTGVRTYVQGAHWQGDGREISVALNDGSVVSVIVPASVTR